MSTDRKRARPLPRTPVALSVLNLLAEPVEVSREGRRPERTVYAITEAARDELPARHGVAASNGA